MSLVGGGPDAVDGTSDGDGTAGGGSGGPGGSGGDDGPGEGGVLLREVSWDDAAAVALRRAQEAEIAERYRGGGEAIADPTFEPAQMVSTVVARLNGEPVACGALRDVSGLDDNVGGRHPAGTGEIKRLYVDPAARGHHLSKLIMADLERRAAERGMRRLVLESGTMQPEAIGLYLRTGWSPIDQYGPYAGGLATRCFGKELPAAQAGPASAQADRPAFVVRDVEWADPEAVALRRELTGAEMRLYPFMADMPKHTTGWVENDVALGETVLASVAAYADGHAVGYAALMAPKAGAPPEIRKVVVAEGWQRRGIARALMAEIERRAVELGYEKVWLITGYRQTGAVRLYVSLGYRSVLPFRGLHTDPVGLFFAKELV